MNENTKKQFVINVVKKSKNLGSVASRATATLVTHTKKHVPVVYDLIKKNKKKFIIILVALLVGLFFILKPKTSSKDVTVIPVENRTLISTVKASGKVTSVVDLELSFKKSDLVETVNVSVGEKVKKGQILATLKNQSEQGMVTQARGALARILEGATTEEEKIAEVLLENAQIDLANVQKTQERNIRNAQRTLLSSSLQARPKSSLADQTVPSPTVFGSYTGETEGSYLVTVYPSTGGYAFYTSGLASITGSVSASNTISINNGLSLQFPVNFNLGSNTTWTIDIPNKESLLYTTNLNNYESVKVAAETAIASAQALVLQRQAELALKKSNPRSSDVLSAQGQLQNALGTLENTIIRAPASGVVTKVALKPGELAQSLEPVIVIQHVSKLYVEANINESNIISVQEGQPVEFTIDAFGGTRVFKGTVTQVDLAPTIKDGIVNYKIKASLDENDPMVKSGMNANLIITTGVKENVIAISGAALVKKDNKVFIKKIIDSKKKTYSEVEVTTGTTGDGNMVEIKSGITVGDFVALIEKSK